MTDKSMRLEKAKRVANILVRWCELLFCITVLALVARLIKLIELEYSNIMLLMLMWVVFRWIFNEVVKDFENKLQEERWAEEAIRNNTKYEKDNIN